MLTSSLLQVFFTLERAELPISLLLPEMYRSMNPLPRECELSRVPALCVDPTAHAHPSAARTLYDDAHQSQYSHRYSVST